MTVQVDGDLTVGVGFNIGVMDRNLDVIVGCGMRTSAENTGESAVGKIVHSGLTRPMTERISKISSACLRVWRFRVKTYCIRRGNEREQIRKP